MQVTGLGQSVGVDVTQEAGGGLRAHGAVAIIVLLSSRQAEVEGISSTRQCDQSNQSHESHQRTLHSFVQFHARERKSGPKKKPKEKGKTLHTGL